MVRDSMQDAGMCGPRPLSKSDFAWSSCSSRCVQVDRAVSACPQPANCLLPLICVHFFPQEQGQGTRRCWGGSWRGRFQRSERWRARLSRACSGRRTAAAPAHQAECAAAAGNSCVIRRLSLSSGFAASRHNWRDCLACRSHSLPPCVSCRMPPTAIRCVLRARRNPREALRAATSATMSATSSVTETSMRPVARNCTSRYALTVRASLGMQQRRHGLRAFGSRSFVVLQIEMARLQQNATIAASSSASSRRQKRKQPTDGSGESRLQTCTRFVHSTSSFHSLLSPGVVRRREDCCGFCLCRHHHARRFQRFTVHRTGQGELCAPVSWLAPPSTSVTAFCCSRRNRL